jgi:hypothetical protein
MKLYQRNAQTQLLGVGVICGSEGTTSKLKKCVVGQGETEIDLTNDYKVLVGVLSLYKR